MRTWTALLLVVGMNVAAGAQTPPGATPSPATSAPAASPNTAPSTDIYTYSPDGRRDPFVALLGAPSGDSVPLKTGDGLTALLVNEISVRGVLQSKGSLIAMVQAPDKKTYVIHQGDRFADGVVKAVTTQGLVIVQDVNDPLSLVKQREVRKLLRSLEDAKQ
jgi:Tfp pilus assembly protein PilP